VVSPFGNLRECFVTCPAGATLDDHHVLDAGAFLDRLVGIALERNDLATSIAGVGRDQHPALGVVDAVAERL
jgi:hypothetical protein